MALDSDFRIRYASDLLVSMLGPQAASQVRGLSIESLLGAELFGLDGPLRQALLAGEKREGWRAVLNVESGPARLMSVSAAPLLRDRLGVCDPEAAYLVVLRPADESTIEASGPIAGFGLIARSPAMTRIFRMIDVLQHSESTVLVTGESGTGKEVMARIIHAHSPRKSGPFVAVNAAALPGELLESELFGHVRGAFTGAVRDRAGRFEGAEDGTLFLDEVGDVPLHLQVKLLRVLQERTYERVGDSQTRRTNARIIAATNRNLRRLVADGRFREDLYYRLRVFPLELPPLRSRREDIEPMARLLLSRVGSRTGRALRLSPEAVRVLLSYEWPGNVRELENALEFAATVCQGQTLQPEDLPPEVIAAGPPPGEEPAPLARTRPTAPLPIQDDRELRAALELNRWNREATARALGVSRSTLWRRMRAASLS
jgi:transcriptional regulator with GAF, ATPase, and Fis domain